MKRILLTVMMLSSMIPLYSQNEPMVYRITFTDKANSVFNLDHPQDFLSPRAIDRRGLSAIAITEDDLPVSTGYLSQIEQLGARLLVKSKWLNTIFVEVQDPSVIEQIRTLHFVREAIGAENWMKKTEETGDQPELTEKSFFAKETYSATVPRLNVKSASSVLAFDYGPSLNQIQMINGTGLHNDGYTGGGMIIAVLDAGFWNVDEMPVFDSLWANGQILGTKNFVNPDESVFDDNIHQHGTMVLSTMGGNMPGYIVGTAPHAGYYLLRTEDGTAEYLMEEYYWVMGAEYADSVGADIINSSLGYTEFDNPAENHTYADMDGNTTPITIGADIAAKKGILVTNSAGNSGGSAWLYIGAPADGDSVFSIGAVDAWGNYATFSSIGPTYDGRIKPNIAAQGQETIIASPWDWNNVASGSGTSFSSPIIAGMSACLWQANPDYSNMEIINAIHQSASQYDDPDYYLGYGIPDYGEANNLLAVSKMEVKPKGYSLQISPNPFKDHLLVSFISLSVQTVRWEVYDFSGKLLTGNEQPAGTGQVFFDIDTQSFPYTGIYLIKLITAEGIYTAKAVKIK